MSSVPTVGRSRTPPRSPPSQPLSSQPSSSQPSSSQRSSSQRSSSQRSSSQPAPSQRSFWRIAFGAVLAALGFVTVAAALSSGLGLIDMARWAATQQRAFHSMVSQLLGLEDGGPLAASALIAACFAYGFLHAAIPGHGKFVIAGAALASRMSLVRLIALSGAASLAQAVTAIVLVYGSFALLNITAGWAMSATDKVLIPLSYLAIFAIGLVLMHRAIRGLRTLWQAHAHRLDLPHTHGPGCDHRHGPSLAEADAVRSWRDAAILVVGIGLRPCTGAVFVLVAAWRMGLIGVGAGAAVAMAVGTGAFISLVALSAVTARGATLFAAGAEHVRIAVPLLQLLAGGAIVLVSVAFLVGAFLPPL